MIDAFLKVKGMKGECTDGVYKGKGVIQLLDCTVNGETPSDDEEGEVISSPTDEWVDETGYLRRHSIQVEAPPPTTGTPEEKATKPEPKWPFTFDITKRVDATTPLLFTKYCRYKVLTNESQDGGGSYIASAKLWVRKGGAAAANDAGLTYVIWEFRKLQVINFYWSTSGPDVEEKVSFRFASCQLSYTPQSNTGAKAGEPISSPWNLQSNTKTVDTLADSEVLA